MHTQKGNTLLISIILLSIVTLIATYNMESSGMQMRMVSNSLMNLRAKHISESGAKKEIREQNALQGSDFVAHRDTTATFALTNSTALDNGTFSIQGDHMHDVPAASIGYEADVASQIIVTLYEMHTSATYKHALANHTYGVGVVSLRDPNSQEDKE